MKNALFIFAASCMCLTANATHTNDSAQFYFKKGMEEKAAKHYLVAATNFTKAIQFDNAFTDAYIENGYTNLEMRKLDVAKQNFEKAYNLQPSNADITKQLTNIYFDFRQWDKAIEFAKKCKSCDNSARIIGMASYEKESYIEAERNLMEALKNNPADAVANYTLARTYIDLENYKKAVPYFEKATSQKPENNAWAFELGLLYFNNNDFKGATVAFENAEKNGYPTGNDFNENYGYALLYAGDYAKGEEKLFNIYKIKGNREILREIAQAMYDQKQYQRSLDYCERLLRLDGKDAKALYQAGLAFQKMGQKEKGQGFCDKAIEMDPSLASKRTKQMNSDGAL